MTLLSQWDDLVVPDDLTYFEDPDGGRLVTNPGLAAWALLTPDQYAVLGALATGEPPPDRPDVDRVLGLLLLKWLIHLPGKAPVVRDPEPELRMLYYAITEGCNLRCPYCYASSAKKLPGELEHEESLDLMRQAAAMGVETVVFTGGEPMLRRDLFEVAAYAKSLGMRANIITNATLIDSVEKAQEMADTFGVITVSMDGGTAELHEPTRGKGTFDKTVNALRMLNQVGVRPIINHVVSERNVGRLDAMGELLDDIDVRQVRLMQHSALGRGVTDDVTFGWTEYQRAHDFVWTSPLARNLLPDGPVAGKPCSVRGNCGLGGTEIYVNSLGEVYPCKLVTSRADLAGNVRETPLAELYATPGLKELRTASVFSGEGLADCRHCYIRGACGGGCRAYHQARSGDLHRNARSFCRILRHQMVTSMWNAVGAGPEVLTGAGDKPYTPVSVRTGEVHPAYQDWAPAHQLLPLFPVGSE